LVTAPGFGWINAFTVASEIGDIERFASPTKLCGYTGLTLQRGVCRYTAMPEEGLEPPTRGL
jgi:hypothetical protein